MRFLLLFLWSLSISWTNAQNYILPFSGFKCHAQGIESDEVEIKLNGSTWTSNFLPQNAEFDIRLNEPKGFVAKDSLFQPGIEVFICDMNQDTLGYAANIYGEGFPGYDIWMFKRLNVTLGFGPEVLSGDSLFIKTRFFDQNGTGSFSVEGIVQIVDSTTIPDNASMTNYVKSFKGFSAASTGATITEMGANLRDDARKSLEIQWILEDVYALDISMAETTVWLYFSDGSIKKLNRFEQFNYEFSTILEKTNKDVLGKISCYLKGVDLASLQFVRIRTYSKTKGIVVDGIVDMKKFLH